MGQEKVTKNKVKPVKSKESAALVDRTNRIRERAYELYLQREPGQGSSEDDWYRAEQELFSDQ